MPTRICHGMPFMPIFPNADHDTTLPTPRAHYLTPHAIRVTVYAIIKPRLTKTITRQ